MREFLARRESLSEHKFLPKRNCEFKRKPERELLRMR